MPRPMSGPRAYPSMPSSKKPSLEAAPEIKPVEQAPAPAVPESTNLVKVESLEDFQKTIEGKSENIRKIAFGEKERKLEKQSTAIQERIDANTAEAKMLEPGGARGALRAEKMMLEKTQKEIASMILELKKMNRETKKKQRVEEQTDTIEMAAVVPPVVEAVPSLEVPDEDIVEGLDINMTREMQQVEVPVVEEKVPDALTPWFAGKLAERTEDGVTYGEFSSAEEEELGFSKEFKSAFGDVALVTNAGGKNSKYSTRNEDTTFAISRPNGFVMGAIDGMGGEGVEGGRKASRLVSAVTEQELRQDNPSLKEVSDVIERVFKANRDIHKGGAACGVVMEMVVAKDGSLDVEVLAAGDSKMLALRGGKKLDEGTTKLQNLAAYQLAQRELEEPGMKYMDKYYNHGLNHKVTGGFGANGGEKPVVISFKGQPEDRYIMASDGLWDVVSEYEVEQLSEQFPNNNDFQTELFNLAMERNGGGTFTIMHDKDTPVQKTVSDQKGDNITIAVMTVGGKMFEKAQDEEAATRKRTETIVSSRPRRKSKEQLDAEKSPVIEPPLFEEKPAPVEQKVEKKPLGAAEKVEIENKLAPIFREIADLDQKIKDAEKELSDPDEANGLKERLAQIAEKIGLVNVKIENSWFGNARFGGEKTQLKADQLKLETDQAALEKTKAEDETKREMLKAERDELKKRLE